MAQILSKLTHQIAEPNCNGFTRCLPVTNLHSGQVLPCHADFVLPTTDGTGPEEAKRLRYYAPLASNSICMKEELFEVFHSGDGEHSMEFSVGFVVVLFFFFFSSK